MIVDATSHYFDRQPYVTPALSHTLLLLVYNGLCTGLELYENVLSPDEQANMIAIVEGWVVQVRMPDYALHSAVVLINSAAAVLLRLHSNNN